MHILFIHQAFTALDEAGGTRHYEMAAYLVKKGHRVSIIASPISYLSGKAAKAKTGQASLEEPMPGLQIYRAYTYPALHRSFVHRVFSFISFMASSFWLGLSIDQVDLVWGTSPPIFQAAGAWLLARLKRVPFLFEVRDLWPAFAIQVGVLRNRLLIRLSLWLERFLYSHAERVMVNSPGYVEHVRQKGAKRVELVPNGVDPSMFQPESDGLLFRQEHGLVGKFIILYAGAHGLSNDLGIIIKAAQKLRETNEIQFVLVGDGKDKPALRQMAAENNLGNVSFLNPITKDRVGQALAAADACIAILKPIELYKTTYPNKVFDYMAAGRPVLLAIDGVIREVVENAEAGLFCQPGDPDALAEAARQLYTQPEKSRKMGLNGRQYICDHFERTRFSAELEKLLDEMIKEHA